MLVSTTTRHSDRMSSNPIVVLIIAIISISGFSPEAKVVFSPEGKSSNELRFETNNDYDDDCEITVSRGQEIISSTLTQTGHFTAISIKVEAFGDTFVLDLKLNTYLFKVGYVEKFFRNGVAVYNDARGHIEDHCYYLGEVRGQPHSSTAISTCKGISGYFAIGDVAYHIEPKGNQLNSPHKVYRSRGGEKTRFRCGHDSEPLGSLMNPSKLSRRIKRSFPWPQDKDSSTKVVELYVANSHSQYQAQSSDVNKVIQRAKDIVNTAASAYQSLGIYLVLVGIEVWSSEERITISTSDPNATLFSFIDYRFRQISPYHTNDNAVLIVHDTFDKSVVGFSAYGEMCSIQNSASFVSDISPEVTGTILAHEMGHSFGFQHDNDLQNCVCNASDHICIMQAAADTGSATSPVWSSCSTAQLQVSFNSGLGYCLDDIPRTIYDSTARCGNGIVETGEDCDCGKDNQECSATCCNPSTCKLAGSATCAYGRCCHLATCQILPCGTSCRLKAGDCDLEEYCNGQSPLCPQDTYKPDATTCTTTVGDNAFCYRGRCASRESQCQFLAGAHGGSDACYTKYNVAGDVNGNCGINWFQGPSYNACSSSNVLCGSLQCQQNSKQPPYKLIYRIATKSASDTGVCNSAIFAYGPELLNPGFVPNGSPCGSGMMCINMTCVSTSTVPTVSCSPSCQSNQTCNNMRQCQNTTFSTSGKCTIIPTTTGTTQSTVSGASPALSTLAPTVSAQNGVPSNPSSTRNPVATGNPGSTISAGATGGSGLTTRPPGSLEGSTTLSDAASILQQAVKAALIGIVLGSALAAVTAFACLAFAAAKCFGFQ